MNFKRHKFVRFEDWSSDKSSSSEQQISTEDGLYLRKSRSTVSSVMGGIQRGFEKGSEGIKSLKNSLSFRPSSDQPTKESCRKRILDPRGSFLQNWNKIFVLSCVIAVSLDPLFFYIPVIDDIKKCLDWDWKMAITACVLRSCIDIFYILHILFQFHTGFTAPSSRVFGRGELIEDRYAIAKRYLSSYFIIDVLSVLPLPQVALLNRLPMNLFNVHVPLITKLKLVIFSQNVPRFIRIYPLYMEVTRISGVFTETAWAGAALNLFLYIVASYVVGAIWYLFTIERQISCWSFACEIHNMPNDYLDCGGRGIKGNYSFLNSFCLLREPSEMKNQTDFDFGIFLGALKSNMVDRNQFPQKLFFCSWWGLRNLSSLGQNLDYPSSSVWEILFAVSITIVGLVLFSLLIGNMQRYLQSMTVRVEEMRVKRQDAEQWMSHRMLPENLRERIRRYEQYRWQETRGVEEKSLILNLPKDIRRDIKRHLCCDLLKRVPMFEMMDEQLFDAMCEQLKPVLYTEKSFIVREGDPVDEMLFVMQGNLSTMTTNGGRTCFPSFDRLQAGDFCGEELLTWALDPNSSSILPTSTRTVKSITDVEAFALMADDLKSVASQFRRLHSKHLQHTFRFYSQQWRSWGARLIQAAWRRHCRRKLDKSLREEEDRLQDALAKECGSSPSLGATIYASKFATNALQALQRNHAGNPKSPQLHRLPPLLLQKPVEPDFTAEDR